MLADFEDNPAGRGASKFFLLEVPAAVNGKKKEEEERGSRLRRKVGLRGSFGVSVGGIIGVQDVLAALSGG